MKLVHVEQKHNTDCAIACVAMVTGQTYEQALEQMGDDRGGFSNNQIFAALAIRGFAVQVVSQREQIQYTVRKPWPISPWAPAHLITVVRRITIGGSGCHLIAMSRDGIVYDPSASAEACKERPLSFYPDSSIISMMGVFSVTGYPLFDKGVT